MVMTYNVEIEFDIVDYDADRTNSHLIIEWLIDNFGSSIGKDRTWDIRIDYKRPATRKLLTVYSFKNSQDALLFALRWA